MSLATLVHWPSTQLSSLCSMVILPGKVFSHESQQGRKDGKKGIIEHGYTGA